MQDRLLRRDRLVQYSREVNVVSGACRCIQPWPTVPLIADGALDSAAQSLFWGRARWDRLLRGPYDVLGLRRPRRREDVMRLQGSSDRRGWIAVAIVIVILAILAYLVFFTTIL